jgi:ribosomal protein S18 acetylase RimI-like enzyme
MIELRPATLEAVRPLRLRALREDPDAFGSTREREQERTDAEWEFWIAGTLIAFDGDAPVGMAKLKIDGDCAQLLGMWVAPQSRGRGVGELLVRALADRADGRAITLCVAETAPDARRLYERLGFVPTGTTGTLRPGSAIATADLRLTTPGRASLRQARRP